MLADIFAKMDADKSDYVDADEFKSIFSDIAARHASERMVEIDGIADRGDSDGRLTQQEFVDFMLEYYADQSDRAFCEKIAEMDTHVGASFRKLLLRRVFSRMDVDRSGAVSFEEFRALMGEHENAANFENFFAWIDANIGDGDGLISQEEWVRYFLEEQADFSDDEFQATIAQWTEVIEQQRRVTALRQIFYKMDADCSGTVDMGEFLNLLEDDGSGEAPDKSALAMVYKYLDKEFGDADGELSMEEWVQGMRTMGNDLPENEFEEEIAKWSRVLTANQRKVWRGCFNRGNAKAFTVSARAAGATHVLFVTHGNCLGSPNGRGSVSMPPIATGEGSMLDAAKANDLERALTDRGSAQCAIARDEWFGRLPMRKTMLSCPTERARSTAMHISGNGELAGSAPSAQPLLVIERLHPSGASEGPTFDKAVELVSSAGQRGEGHCLRELLDADGGESAFGLYAEATCEELARKFRAENEKPSLDGHRERATYISVFGDSAYLAAVAHAVGTAAGIDATALEEMLDIKLGEAEGVLVPLYGEGKMAIHLRRPV